MRFWAPRFLQHARSPVPCPRYTDPVASKLIWWTGIVDTKPRPRPWAPPLPIHGTPSPKPNTIYDDGDDEIVGVLDLLWPSPFSLSLSLSFLCSKSKRRFLIPRRRRRAQRRTRFCASLAAHGVTAWKMATRISTVQFCSRKRLVNSRRIGSE
jgi:hypothetical protein